jgi:phosphopantothenoylcysteine decarboxylase / phosphopantothenate---cysteine ligase
MLEGKHIVIGITGGIAAYKIPYLVRLLVKEGAEVRIMMTHAATDFVTPLTLSTLSQNEVIIEPFDETTGSWNSHVDLGQWADLMLFAPATANTMGKMAHGIADNFLTTAYLSAKCAVFLAPSMDLDMFLHPTTQKNLEILRSFGNTIIEPKTGDLASGLTGPGRMEEPEEIFGVIRDFFFQPNDLKDRNILITAGPTFEPIDDVRFLGNHSSGRMGFALAKIASDLGAKVTLVSGPVSLETPDKQIRRIDIQTAEEMLAACNQEIRDADILIMAAAVADYRMEEPIRGKHKKTNQPMELRLTQTPDVLKSLSAQKRADQCFVGFALESDDGMASAQKKLKEKSLDIIVLNSLKDEGAGFGGTTNKVTILTRFGEQIDGDCKPKSEVAAEILSVISDYLSKQQST